MAEKEKKDRINVKVVKGEDNELPSLVAIQKGIHRQSHKDDIYEGEYTDDGLIAPPYPQKELAEMVEYSTILQQCIEAYKRNITGFGTKVTYTTDENQTEETTEMQQEKERVESFIKNFNFEQSFEDVWGDALGNREKTGNGYIEVIRDGKGEPAEGYSLDPQEMRLTRLGNERIEVTYMVDGTPITRHRKFRRFAQKLQNGNIVWFKEFGDPRIMSAKTGKYEDELDATEQIAPEDEATEIIHLKIGTRPYGVPRWIGQLIHMYGARKAEELNYNYFYNGRHNPAALVVTNGLLTEESEAALKEYSGKVGGTDNAHKFLVIEVEGTETDDLPGEEKVQSSKAEFKSLADMLQQDALFLEYDDASRMKVQSAFRLPDIYVGRSKDFNRATADTARYITEEQVFEPERNSIEFTINNQLFRGLELQYTKMAFEKPEISNVEDMTKLLAAINAIGGVAPNDVRPLLAKTLGKPIEEIPEDIANMPTKLATMIQAQMNHEEQMKQNQQQQGNQPPQKGGKQQKVQKEFTDILKDIRDEVELYNGKIGNTA